jgi:hypothetical protein
MLLSRLSAVRSVSRYANVRTLCAAVTEAKPVITPNSEAHFRLRAPTGAQVGEMSVGEPFALRELSETRGVLYLPTVTAYQRMYSLLLTAGTGVG